MEDQPLKSCQPPEIMHKGLIWILHNDLKDDPLTQIVISDLIKWSKYSRHNPLIIPSSCKAHLQSSLLKHYLVVSEKG